MRRALITIAACAVTLGGASAQEVYIDDADAYDDDTYIEAPAVVEEESVIVEERPTAEGVIIGPRVYGWSEIRPANCGTFRYWNGETCADARFDPPPAD